VGSAVVLKGYLNDQQVISGTDAHGLDGFSVGALDFATDSAGAEVRFNKAKAVVPDASAPTTRSG
jgi:hypothetical protein